MKNILAGIKQKYQYSMVLLRQLVITDFKLRYKGSALGYVWSLLKPMAMFAVMYVVFIHYLKFGQDEPHFAVALLLGIVLWNYFAEATMNGMSAIVSKGDLMRKLAFPRYVLVLSGSFSALINLVINLLVVSVLIALNGVDISWRALGILPVIIELHIFSLAVALLLSTLYVKLRDVNYIWELILQVGFYATPIFYPMSVLLDVSLEAAKAALLNPMAQIIQDARWSLVSPDTLTTWKMFDGGPLAFVPIALVLIILVVGVLYFKKSSPHFAEDV